MILKCIDFITLTRDKPLNKRGWVFNHRNSSTALTQPSTFRIAEADLVVKINFIAQGANLADDVCIADTAGCRSFQPQCCINHSLAALWIKTGHLVKERKNRNLNYIDAKAYEISKLSTPYSAGIGT